MAGTKRNNGNFWPLAHKFLGSYLPNVRNLSQNTIDAYKQSLKDFIDYLEKQKGIKRKNIPIEAFNRNTVQEYMAYLNTQRKLAPKTCGLRLTAIKSFLKYCSDEDLLFEARFHEVYSINGMKSVKKPVKYLPENAMSTLLKMPKNGTDKERRNRMLLIFLYDTAVRVQELTNMELRDLHLNRTSPFITVRNGKGNKLRNIPLMAKTVNHLKHYIAEFHPGRTPDSNRPLFYSTRDNLPHKLTTDAIRIILSKYVDMARELCPDIPEKVGCHTIRKTRAMDLYRNGIPLPFIMELLGHESEATTKTFYAFATVDMLHDAIAKSNPEIANDKPQWKKQEILSRLYSFD
ncbi:tyrosine-type recombinase/integrase [Desulfoscipio gibsoniae]|uniref:Site-specific recombinase XerD n=1 Tax=Desulfoscipio gibsoniae DSM 7213 TaxID=767817 RepID=R4KPN6_9FIRM|nr:tyrosine-type recombinase/integrase [Desulfoscipio gibsoniae]AGL02520.1 site-specific recombinase XerD [Desulfoscipio gibsoniae DSM 7213]